MTANLRMVMVFGAVLLALLADVWFVNRPEPHGVSEFNPFIARLDKEELILGGAVADSGPLLANQGRNELIEVIAERGFLSPETAHMLSPQHPPDGGSANVISYMGPGETPQSNGVPPCTSAVYISLENPAAGELHIFQKGVAGGSAHREIELMATGTRLVAELNVLVDDPSHLPPVGCQRDLAIGDAWSHPLTGLPLKILAADGSAIRLIFKPASSTPLFNAADVFEPFQTTNVRARTVHVSPFGSQELTRLVKSVDTRPSIDVANLLIGPDSLKAVLQGVGWVTVDGRPVGPTFAEWMQASYARAAVLALINVALLFGGLWWSYSRPARPANKIGGVRVWPGPRDGLRVFLCHCSEDKATVRELYTRLLADEFAPWLDEEDIRGGRAWESEIERALNEVHAVVICLSREFAVKTGYVQKELRVALELATYRPMGQIYVIPVRLEQCPIPPDLLKLQCIDLYRDGGYERLVEILRERARQVQLNPGAAAAAAG